MELYQGCLRADLRRGAVAIGILAVLFGIARLALLGWLIAEVFKGVPLDELILPFVGVGAVMIVRDGSNIYAPRSRIIQRQRSNSISAR